MGRAHAGPGGHGDVKRTTGRQPRTERCVWIRASEATRRHPERSDAQVEGAKRPVGQRAKRREDTVRTRAAGVRSQGRLHVRERVFSVCRAWFFLRADRVFVVGRRVAARPAVRRAASAPSAVRRPPALTKRPHARPAIPGVQRDRPGGGLSRQAGRVAADQGRRRVVTLVTAGRR